MVAGAEFAVVHPDGKIEGPMSHPDAAARAAELAARRPVEADGEGSHDHLVAPWAVVPALTR